MYILIDIVMVGGGGEKGVYTRPTGMSATAVASSELITLLVRMEIG